jgi:hypothetical protein
MVASTVTCPVEVHRQLRARAVPVSAQVDLLPAAEAGGFPGLTTQVSWFIDSCLPALAAGRSHTISTG